MGLVATEGRQHQGDGCEHHEQRRQETTGPSEPELLERERPRRRVFGEEQERDQVAADDEEDLDPEEAAGQPRHSGVVEEDSDDRDRPEPVEAAEVARRLGLRLFDRDLGRGRYPEVGRRDPARVEGLPASGRADDAEVAA